MAIACFNLTDTEATALGSHSAKPRLLGSKAGVLIWAVPEADSDIERGVKEVDEGQCPCGEARREAGGSLTPASGIAARKEGCVRASWATVQSRQGSPRSAES